MKKRAKVVLTTLIALALVTSGPLSLHPAVHKSDPNVIHVPAENPASEMAGQLIKILTPEPDYNPFNKVDQMVVDRNTNTFYLYSVSDDAAAIFERESNLMVANGAKTITISLHSPGGIVDDADIITEQMRILKSRGVHIKTVVADKNACMSACPLIFFAGDERIAYANSVFMFHGPYMQFPYNISEDVIAHYMKELRGVKDAYASTLLQYCPADPTIRMDIFDHDEHYYRADELAVRCPGTFFTSVIPVAEQKSLTSFGL